MPEKKKYYDRVIFSPEVIKEAEEALTKSLSQEDLELSLYILSIDLPQESWSHNNEEEFFADYRKDFKDARFCKMYRNKAAQTAEVNFSVRRSTYSEPGSIVTMSMPTRTQVERVFEVVEVNVDKCRLPELTPEEPRRPTVRVFIGHGQNGQWRDLKDHLHEKHGFELETYEIGARAGLTIKEVLEDMLTSSSIAFLVLTGEDEDAEGTLHARENVIHELGLFQGRLGWRRAIALLEDGVPEFSNIHGLNQIRFAKANIQETFGEVLATIGREFRDKE